MYIWSENMARKKIKEGSNVNIVNTIDSVTDIINKILTNKLSCRGKG